MNRFINDPIHGLIQLDKKLFSIIDTPIFQRLRSLKQLGGAYFVFPGASHNRFEHCIGTCYLAGRWIKDLRDKFIAETTAEEGSIIINEKEIFLVEIAASWPKEKNFLFQIVSNKATSIDVDKFDYLARDCYAANLGLDARNIFERLMQFSKICFDDEGCSHICFGEKEDFNIHQLFHIRYSFHKEVYSHKVIKAVELMIGDILKEADDYFNISDIITEKDYGRYALLNDSIIEEVERSPVANVALQGARALVTSLRERQIYKYVGKIQLEETSSSELKFLTKQTMTKLRDAFRDPQNDVSALACPVTYNYGLLDRHPLKNTWFYSDSTKRIHQKSAKETSALIPQFVLEGFIYVYSTDAHPENLQKVVKLCQHLKDSQQLQKSELMFSPKAKNGGSAPSSQQGPRDVQQGDDDDVDEEESSLSANITIDNRKRKSISDDVENDFNKKRRIGTEPKGNKLRENQRSPTKRQSPRRRQTKTKLKGW
eukprot:TRINITY_DN853_c0_g1_i1.p1 TRINITY_DN853_c0_g1~~TRINITY_DN853_c0_g1_i1.p1  ORF type:complete len:496 (-),score=8.50 TRINITY_DN853_c0_g1_i1:350-1804(-)